jgi:hypothetical protein
MESRPDYNWIKKGSGVRKWRITLISTDNTLPLLLFVVKIYRHSPLELAVGT